MYGGVSHARHAGVGARIRAHLKEEAIPPFDLPSPNAETVEAMEAARRGELVKVGSVENLLADLHADA